MISTEKVWFENLRTLDVDRLKPLMPGHAEAESAPLPISENRRHVRTTARREFLDALSISNVVKHLQALPPPGTTLSCVCSGNYSYGDLLHALLRLCGDGSRFDELVIATLTLSARNVAMLIDLIDRGLCGRLLFLDSTYHRSMLDGAKVYGQFEQQLLARGGPHRLGDARQHCKVIAARMNTGQYVVSMGSANLRSARTIECFELCDNRDLFLFHRRWIAEALGCEL